MIMAHTSIRIVFSFSSQCKHQHKSTGKEFVLLVLTDVERTLEIFVRHVSWYGWRERSDLSFSQSTSIFIWALYHIWNNNNNKSNGDYSKSNAGHHNFTSQDGHQSTSVIILTIRSFRNPSSIFLPVEHGQLGIFRRWFSGFKPTLQPNPFLLQKSKNA